MLHRVKVRPWFAVALLVAAAVGVLAADTGSAQTRHRPVWTPPWRASFSVRVEDPSGRPLETFRHHGRTFVLGRFGDRYVVRIENRTGERVEAVVSIDGRDAITGRPGDYVRGRGYIVPAHGSTRIDGFRTSLSTVAAFRFTDPEASYSARMGTPENVGVIGVAFFRERPRWRHPWSVPEAARERRPRSAPTAKSKRPPTAGDAFDEPGERRAGNLGTEFGERRYSHVVEVPFERANRRHPTRIVTLRYDDAEGLKARGIDVYRYRHGRYTFAPAPEPRPFPHTRFAQPPPLP